MPRLIVIIATFALCLHSTMSVASCGSNLDRPRIGLVLSGGGARGAAHVGVIKVLEELNIPVDCISGTSMGAIVGGLYASGMTADELEQVLYGLDWADALKDSPSRQNLSFRRKQDDVNFLIDFDIGFRDGKVRLPKGLVQGQKLSLLLRELIKPVEGIRDFDQLPIPFRAVATDIESGQMIVLGRGDLVTAIKASMSAPGVFAPVERDGKLLIDGGIANNLPVDVVRAMGADVLIVVDIGFPLVSREQLTSALSMTNQMLTILIRRKSDQQLNTLRGRDIALLPELGDIGSTDFHRSAEAVPLGKAAAQKEQLRLSKLALDDQLFANYQTEKLSKRDFTTRIVRNLSIEDNSEWSKKVIEGSISTLPKHVLNIDHLHADISKLYGLDTFESVDYEIEHLENNLADVTIKARKKDWGPNFVNLGINLIDDFDGSSGYNLAMRYTKTQVNPLGAEWRSDIQIGDQPLFQTEFYQPLNYASKYFIAPQFTLAKEPVFQFNSEGEGIAEFRLSTAQFSLDVGQTIGQNSEVRVGISRSKGRVSKRIGAPEIDERVKFDTGAYRFRYSYDRRDNLRFTRSGNFGSLQWDGFRKSLGDERDNDRLSFDVGIAKSWDDNTYLLFTRGGTNLNADGQIEDLFEIGGLFNLSGYEQRELRGQHAFLVGLAYYRHIGLGSSTFETPLYIGATIEAGNVWDDSDDVRINDLIPAGSVFIGLDTFVGPLYLAYGLGEGGRSATYFRLGQLFD